MKKTLFIASLALCTLTSKAQIKHYINLNTIGHYNYFNKEKDRGIGAIAPSYKIEKNKMGLEVFYNWRGIAYYYGKTFSPEYMPNGGIRQILSYTLGIAYHYNILEKKYLKINPMLGVTFCEYNPTVIDGWSGTAASGGWNEPYFRDEFERRFGLLTGININIPIWRGMYANTNARYALYPSAQFNKQNLILDFGLGYMFQNKKAKK